MVKNCGGVISFVHVVMSVLFTLKENLSLCDIGRVQVFLYSSTVERLSPVVDPSSEHVHCIAVQ